MATIAQQLGTAEAAKLNPLGLDPLVEFQAKKGCKIDKMIKGGQVPSPYEIKDGERLIVRIDGIVKNGKHENIGVTFLDGSTAMISTEFFHRVDFTQFSNKYNMLSAYY